MVDVASTADLNAAVAALQAQISGPPIGPIATGTVTADFSTLMQYPGKGAQFVQQVVDRKMYGTSTGGAADNAFNMFLDQTYRSLIGSVNPGLWYVNGNEAGWYFNADGSVNTRNWNTLLQYWPQVDPLGVSSLIIGVNWDSVPFVNGNAANYGKVCGNLAQYLSHAIMSNGQPLPLIGFCGHDEPDGIDMGIITAMMNAASTAIKAANPALLIMGPQASWAGALMPQFMQNVHVDVCSWDMYPAGTDLGTQVWTNPQYFNLPAGGMANMAGLAPYAPKAWMIGGFNMDWNCAAKSQHTYIGAMWAAIVVHQSLNNAPGPFWCCIWDAEGDGTCGFVPDPNNPATPGAAKQLTPFAYLWRQGVQRVYGPRWQVKSQIPNLLTLAVTPSPGHASLMLTNAGMGSQTAATIALSRCPGLPPSGNGTASVWTMGTSVTGTGQDGTVTQVPVTGGTLKLNLPDPSITIISV